MQVISRLMEFEGKSYWEQIDMVCDELKKAEQIGRAHV